MRNVLVTGVSNLLGRRLVEHLREEPGVTRVVGVETAATTDWIDGVELTSFGSDHRECVAFLRECAIDTVVHCGLAPDRSGSRVESGEARVIETMRLGAAVGHEDVPVRAWVVASSSSVYAIDSHAPLLHRENGDVDERPGQPAASLLEAESYAIGVAEQNPHLNVAILRLQQLCGAGVRGSLAALLGQPVLPMPIGFDPPLQLLAIDDAVRALTYAARLELAGIYNVASSGVLHMSEVGHTLDRPTLPVLPISAGPLAPLARRLRLPHVPVGLGDLLRFGHAVDTSKLAAAGFRPEHDQRACLTVLRDQSDGPAR